MLPIRNRADGRPPAEAFGFWGAPVAEATRSCNSLTQANLGLLCPVSEQVLPCRPRSSAAGIDPGCVKTLRGMTAPRILRLAVTLRAEKRKNSSSARRYDQIRFRFHTAWTHLRHRARRYCNAPAPLIQAKTLAPRDSKNGQYRTSTNCDDPVHGSSPGETHLLWGPGESLPTLKAGPEKMKLLLPGHRYQKSSSTGRSTGDDIRLLVRLDLIAFCP
jgi:hypothetical protein